MQRLVATIPLPNGHKAAADGDTCVAHGAPTPCDSHAAAALCNGNTAAAGCDSYTTTAAAHGCTGHRDGCARPDGDPKEQCTAHYGDPSLKPVAD